MTLTDSTNRVQYTGDGSTTSFAITFVFWDADDPQVTHADSSGTETTWTRGTQYTITGGSGATGTLTVVTSPTDYTPALNETLTIKSNLANTQPTSLPAGGELPSGTLEQQLDQIVRQLQQFGETVGRGITLKISSTENDVTIEDLDGNTGKFAQVNAAEDGFTYASVTSSGTITDPVPVANGGTGSTSAATAITALGAAGTAISNTFTKNQVWNKGSDLSSASPLVLGSTGNYYDVTGTTGFSQITCTAGTLFMLQFDGVLTMTHHSTNLDLPGEANITTAAGDIAICFATGTNTVQVLTYSRANGKAVIGSQGFLQVEVNTDLAMTTGTTVIPNDDTIPQKTEGNDASIDVSITPGASANRLLIVAMVSTAYSVDAQHHITALFQDTTANALAVAANQTTGNTETSHVLIHEMAAGTTSSTTFKIRCGCQDSGTLTFNGFGGARKYGGALPSTLIVMEFEP